MGRLGPTHGLGAIAGRHPPMALTAVVVGVAAVAAAALVDTEGLVVPEGVTPTTAEPAGEVEGAAEVLGLGLGTCTTPHASRS